MKKLMGTSGEYRCSNCNNVSPWQLWKITTWFTLFWIPIFPFSFKYYEMCPVCNRGKKLTKQEFNELLAGAGTQPAQLPIDPINS